MNMPSNLQTGQWQNISNYMPNGCVFQHNGLVAHQAEPL